MLKKIFFTKFKKKPEREKKIKIKNFKFQSLSLLRSYRKVETI